MSIRTFTPVDEWSDPRHRTGLQGEQIAEAYLVSCGYAIEARRFKLGRYDVDLVARRGNTVAFVEVKTRRTDGAGSPLEAVGRRKRDRVGRVAAIWCLRYGRRHDEYRFDLVAITLRRGRAPQVEHVPDAWRL